MSIWLTPPLGPTAKRRFDIFSFSFLYFRRRDRFLLHREMNEFGHLQHHTPGFPYAVHSLCVRLTLTI